MKILKEETRSTRQGPADWFSGTVWLDPVVAGEAPSRLKVTRVTFEPGARTAWHTHPRGQALHVLSGVCQVQLRGTPLQEVASGDSVWIDAGEVHGHGAAPDAPWFTLRYGDPMKMVPTWCGWSMSESSNQ